jgi:hypothetical protein
VMYVFNRPSGSVPPKPSRAYKITIVRTKYTRCTSSTRPSWADSVSSLPQYEMRWDARRQSDPDRTE